jgi:hypothetical protein
MQQKFCEISFFSFFLLQKSTAQLFMAAPVICFSYQNAAVMLNQITLKNAAIFSVGSDGTDGPTDAAGGYVDGDTSGELAAKGIRIPDVLAVNDAYSALASVGNLIITGPTGTNVNDVAVGLIGGSGDSLFCEI